MIQIKTKNRTVLPKEFLLESPAYYDWVSLEKYLYTYIDTYGIEMLSRARNPFKDIVKTEEQQEVIKDIFLFTIDTAVYNISDKRNISKFKKDFRAFLFDAGFFG